MVGRCVKNELNKRAPGNIYGADAVKHLIYCFSTVFNRVCVKKGRNVLDRDPTVLKSGTQSRAFVS